MRLTMHAENKTATVLREITSTLARGPFEHCEAVMEQSVQEMEGRIEANNDSYTSVTLSVHSHQITVVNEIITYEIS